MELSPEFWIGTALAIPLSIIASLLAPRIQSYFDKRSTVAESKRSKALASDLNRISEFKENRDLLREYLLEVIIKTGLYLALTGAIAGPFWAFSGIVYLNGITNAIGHFITLIGALLVLRISVQAIKDINRVKNFDNFKLEVETYLNKQKN
jgi:hypothetical protein